MAQPTSAEIDLRQNEDRNLRRQLAARRYYFEAKLIQFAGRSVATLLALTSPFVLLYWPELGPWLAAAAGLWIFVSRFLLERFRQELVLKGATAQEAFDCTVLGLAWNPSLAVRPATRGHPPREREIDQED